MDYKIKVDELKEDLIKSVQELVKIPSVKGEKTEKYPFGENVDKALVKTLDICKELGFKTYYGDGYYGYAEIGEGDELVGILGHLDVVPEGEIEDWNYEPFGGIIDNGKIYGRGTQDDKGPTLAAIYGCKALLDSGVKFNKRVRFIFGTDEENLWGGITKYMEREEKPSFGFTPDSQFPMIYAEKGLLQAKLKSKNSSEITFSAGNAFNAVPDKAVYNDIKVEEVVKELDRLHIKYKMEDRKIILKGKGAHASKPNEGINAITKMATALNNANINSKAIKFIGELIGDDYNATKIFGDISDEHSGKLTFNIGKININKEEEIISVDIRIPVTSNKDEVVEKLSQSAKEYGLEYSEYDYLESIYIPKDNFLIKTLRKVFEEETELDSEPLTSGGATYARAMENCVAFGAVFPGQEKVEHQANEYIEIDRLLVTTKIYARAIYELTR